MFFKKISFSVGRTTQLNSSKCNLNRILTACISTSTWRCRFHFARRTPTQSKAKKLTIIRTQTGMAIATTINVIWAIFRAAREASSCVIWIEPVAKVAAAVDSGVSSFPMEFCDLFSYIAFRAWEVVHGKLGEIELITGTAVALGISANESKTCMSVSMSMSVAWAWARREHERAVSMSVAWALAWREHERGAWAKRHVRLTCESQQDWHVKVCQNKCIGDL